MSLYNYTTGRTHYQPKPYYRAPTVMEGHWHHTRRESSSVENTPEIEDNRIQPFERPETVPLLDPIVFTFGPPSGRVFRPPPSIVEAYPYYNESVSPYNLHPYTSSLFSSHSIPQRYYVDTSTRRLLAPLLQNDEEKQSPPPPTTSSSSSDMYSCMICKKVFTRPYNLKSHMRTHTHERPYECHYHPCGWKFARPHDLKRHELQHTGQKPHACRFCARRFARSDALKRHWKVDTSCARALREETRLNGGVQIPHVRKKRSKKSP